MRLSRQPFFLWATGVWETRLRVREAGVLKALLADGGTMDLPMVRGEPGGDSERRQRAAAKHRLLSNW